MKMDHVTNLERAVPTADVTSVRPPRLDACLERALGNYFQDLGDQRPSDLYRRVLDQVEPPLLEKVMVHTRGNQSRAADILGISRGTLRTKLKRYGMA